MKTRHSVKGKSTEKDPSLVKIGLKFRCYPDIEQATVIAKNIGLRRYIKNHFLNLRNNHYEQHKDKTPEQLASLNLKKYLSGIDCINLLPQLKQEICSYKIPVADPTTGEIVYNKVDWMTVAGKDIQYIEKDFWLLDQSLSTCLQLGVQDLDNAFDRFFKNVKAAKSKGKKATHSQSNWPKKSKTKNSLGFPQFESRAANGSGKFSITKNNMTFTLKKEPKEPTEAELQRIFAEQALIETLENNPHNTNQHNHSSKHKKLNVENYNFKLNHTKQPLDIKFDRDFNVDKVSKITFTKTSAGEYYITFLVVKSKAELKQEKNKKFAKTGNIVGVDLGMKTTATLFDKNTGPITDKKLEGLKRHEKRLKRAQRNLSKKYKAGKRPQSKNYEKQRLKVAKEHNRLVNVRTDFLNKLSTELVENYDTIYAEDLNIAGMVKNHKWAKGISQQSLGKLLTKISYKCDWYNKTFVKANRYFPSSKLCSKCEHYNQYYGLLEQPLDKQGKPKLQLPDIWTCSECGHTHQRDACASENLSKYDNYEKTYLYIMDNSKEKDNSKLLNQVPKAKEPDLIMVESMDKIIKNTLTKPSASVSKTSTIEFMGSEPGGMNNAALVKKSAENM